MKHVTVIMSTYNGSKSIIKQLDSIFSQEGVLVSCVVRDDGSRDNTYDILEEYSKKIHKLKIIKGGNIGWERSFLEALYSCGTSDYYAFSDQDDIWFNNKLIEGVAELEKHDKNIPLLFHCNRASVNEKLEPLKIQVKKIKKPLSKENAITQEYAQGCSMLINETAKNLICQYRPSTKVAHDFWVGLICYYFGEVYYCKEPLFYHISHGNNASGEGHLLKSWKGRLKKIFHSNAYYNPTIDLLQGYGELLDDKDLTFIKSIIHYKSSIKDKLKLLFNRSFIRSSFIGTLSLKINILFNKL